MSFEVGVTTSAVFGGGLLEDIERAANAGAETFEFYSWQDVDFDAVRETAQAHGIRPAGTLAAGVGSNIGDAEGQAVSYPDDFADAVSDIERSIEAADELGADVLIVTVGQRLDTLSRATQHNAMVRVFREIAPTAAAHGVTVTPEPLNTRVDHPGYVLETSDQAFELIEAVDHPNVKALFDIYHQQITEGNIIQTLREGMEYIGHIHIADVPGRHEPATGELNYANIFDAIVEAGYEGVVACEFGPAGDPAEAVEHVVGLADEARP